MISLSIVIPAYNCCKTISEYLKVLTKDIKPCYELIIVDDGSTDNTYESCLQFESSNVHIYHKSNGGVSSARNFGISKSSGKYIMFLDADDRLIDGWTYIIDDYLNSNQDIIYFGNYNLHEPISTKQIIKSIFGISSVGYIPNMASVWSKLFRRDLIVKYNIDFIHNIINGEDALFSLEALLCSEKYKFVNKSIYLYYVNMSSATHSYNPNFVESNRLFLTKAQNILCNYNIDNILVNDCIKFSIVNSVSSIIQRISYIKGIKPSIKELNRIYNSELNTLTSDISLSPKEYGLLRYIIFLFVKNKLSVVVLLIFKIHKHLTRQNNNVSKYFTI